MAETGAISNFGQAPDGSDVQRIELANGHASAALLTGVARLADIARARTALAAVLDAEPSTDRLPMLLPR